MADMFHKHGGDIYSYKNIQDFSANINAKGMPETVRAAARRGVEESLHYPDPRYRSLRAALAMRENRLPGRADTYQQKASLCGKTQCDMEKEHTVQAGKILPEQIVCGNGAAELMFALTAALRPGKAWLAAPSFFEYEQALRAAGCEIQRQYLLAEDDFRLGESFVEEIPEKTDMIVLGNPNNPTGQVIDRTVLELLIRKCRENKIVLVLDESFYDFLTEEDRGRTLAGAEKTAEYPELFVIKSFTKMYGMPGLRFGYGICSDTEVLERLRGMMQPWNVSIPAQRGAEAAAGELEFARITAEETAVNREWMRKKMEQAGYHVFSSQTNFLLFTAPERLQAYCLERGYLIRDCGNFPGLERTDGRKYFRICIRSMQENMALLAVLRAAGQDLL